MTITFITNEEVQPSVAKITTQVDFAGRCIISINGIKLLCLSTEGYMYRFENVTASLPFIQAGEDGRILLDENSDASIADFRYKP